MAQQKTYYEQKTIDLFALNSEYEKSLDLCLLKPQAPNAPTKPQQNPNSFLSLKSLLKCKI